MTALSILTPLLLLLAVIVAFPRRWIGRGSVQYVLVAGLAILVGRYLCWRFFVTVWPAQTFDVQCAFVWGLFAVELIAWFDGAMLFAALLRRTNRSAEADLHEDGLRELDPANLPVVDVMIATYNETIEVLERSIAGAVAIDWPKDRLRVHVLDDGRREWLRAYAEEKGVRYLTRDDNAHAKAGNINAAIARTSGDFFLVLDADFIPQQNILFRALGFFEDEHVGIVQIPHNFFNHDPMQTNLAMHKALPDDQRLFFDAIMPGRDGWDCAFCCGSNSITRRSAIEAVGGGLPTGSITEDMLLTLVMLRKGYVTRYLNERLAIGLAPESLSAFFVQRARWARGCIQILFLKDGPLGPGLKPRQRLMFLPTHWMSQSLSQSVAMATPAIYLWTGLLPLLNADTAQVFHYQIPAILGTTAVLRIFAPGEFFPLASTAHGVLQAFRLLPVVVTTLIKPFGHAFKVTPKGRDAGVDNAVDMPTVHITIGLIVATGLGLLVNADFDYQLIETRTLVPVVALWAMLNMVILLVVAKIAVTPSRLRAEERFELKEPGRIVTAAAGSCVVAEVELRDLSMSGAMIATAPDEAARLEQGSWAALEITGVGPVAACVQRRITGTDATLYGIEFDLPASSIRDRLIVKLFTEGRNNAPPARGTWAISWSMVARVFQDDKVHRPVMHDRGEVPGWLAEVLATAERELRQADRADILRAA